MTPLRNRSALVGITVVWGILWAAMTIVVGTIITFVDPAQIDAGEAPIVLAPIIGLIGLTCGLAFAVLVSFPRPEWIVDVPLQRAVLWGMAIAALVPVLSGKVIPEILVIAPLGAASAMVSIAVARRWTLRDLSLMR